MTMTSEALTGGFDDPVYNSQSVFRMMMDAMALPGSIMTVRADAAPPPPFGLAAAMIALTVCDHDTPVFLSDAFAASQAPAWLRFHTGAPLVSDPSEAAFAFVDATAPFPDFEHFSFGTQEYPDRSTTIVLEVGSLVGGHPLTLKGPGIRESETIAPLGLPGGFTGIWAGNRALFPRGVDLVLAAGVQFLCLPRSLSIQAMEG
ncbi:phosphonate C-P lyase system protein PhnH [Oryzifoliimicrobium ureilyticus]|uniref:phosphonate C-P lyase system protein PhnH n=1 Tax=Oryzifoliimicrobium ureilyticus TaxID=3113724 RepID=UPI0030764CCD